MSQQAFDLNRKFGAKELYRFANYIQSLSEQIGFKVSARGWAYLLEQNRMINKNQFDKVTNLINKCRKIGFLPIDFVAEESARAFKGIEKPTSGDVVDLFEFYYKDLENTANYYTPDWWDGEEYYIQMVVEKVDLVTLFQPITKRYHIPIANSKGWSSMLQRAEYSRRFAEAEKKGLQCVLLYCGDHDPDGLRISEFINSNLEDLKHVTWSDGMTGYDPSTLIIHRFGLNYDFIVDNNLTWIDNLITGSGRNLASPTHKNYHMEYVQEYLAKYGERKCEANAVVTMPQSAQQLVTQAIEEFLGEDAIQRFTAKREAVSDELDEYLDESGIRDRLDDVREILDSRRDNDEGEE